MAKTIFVIVWLTALGVAYYVTEFTPAAKACQSKGGRYGLDDCWVIMMKKIPG